jgi:hypothetical protein
MSNVMTAAQGATEYDENGNKRYNLHDMVQAIDGEDVESIPVAPPAPFLGQQPKYSNGRETPDHERMDRISFKHVKGLDMNRASMRDLLGIIDADGDGYLTSEEVLQTMKTLKAEQNKVKSLKRVVMGIALAFIVVVCTMIGTSVIGAELAKDQHPTAEGIMRTNSGRTVQTEVPVSYVTLADLPSRSPSFLNNLKTITYIRNGVLVSSGIAEIEWTNSDFMIIHLMRDARKIVINGRSVLLHEGKLTVDLSEQGAAHKARRHLLAVAGHANKAFSMDELLEAARLLEETSGRMLGSSNPLFDLYGLFGGIVAGSVSTDTANAGENTLANADTPADMTIPQHSEWKLTLNGVTSATWYLSYDLASKTARIQQEAADNGSTRVDEMHGGKRYTYNKADTQAILDGQKEQPAMSCDGMDLSGTTCELVQDALTSEIEALVVANANTKDSCVITLDEANGDGSDVQWDYKAGLVQPLGGGAAIWQVGGYFISTSSTGVPTKIVDGEDYTKVVADIHSISELSSDDIAAKKIFQGCVDGAGDNFKLPDSSGRRLATMTEEEHRAQDIVDHLLRSMDVNRDIPHGRDLSWTSFQAWISNTNWCGAGTDIVNTVCPSSTASGDLQADRACRRHDHGAKSNGIIGGMAVRLGCDIDHDLASSTSNWCAQGIFGSWGIAQTWGCFDHGSYNCWNWASKWWGGYWRYGGYCSGEHVHYGPWRYGAYSHRYGYKAKAKSCSGDIW